MTTPIFDFGGITINDPADGYHTNDEVNAFLDSRHAVPQNKMNEFFQAVRIHWDHIHFGDGGDMIFLQYMPNGQIRLQSLNFDYGGLAGYIGLVFGTPP